MSHLRVIAILASFAAAFMLVSGGAQAQLDDPDLVVTNITTDETPTPGTSTRVQTTIENQGGSPSNDFTVNFTLDGDQLGQPVDNGSLGEGESAVLNSTVPWTAEAGQTLVGVSVEHDDGDFTQESNTDNNDDNRSYTIGADLRVDSFDVDPVEVVEGDEIELTATIENAADPEDVAPDAGTFEVGFPIDGSSTLAPVSVEGLAAGESTTVSRTWPTTEGDEGQYSVTVRADSDEEVADRDRSNNGADAVTVQVRKALPDLVVAGATFSPDPAQADRQLTFTAELRNNGQTDAGPHNVSLIVDDETVDQTSIDGLDQAGQRNVSLTWTAEAGNHDIEIRTDVDDAIEETSEDNNRWTLTLPVGPDLVPDSLDIQPPEPRAGDRVRFTAQITNDGQAVDQPFSVSFAVDGTPISSEELTGLDGGEARNVTSMPWNATTGDHDVTAIVDPDDEIGEVDRQNNQFEQSLTVGEPRPNVVVLSASLDPVAPEDGEQATVRAKVENAGAREADAFTVRSLVDDEEIGQASVDGLGAGETTDVELGEWTAETGSHELAIEADVDEEIEEGNEQDNRFVRELGIGADLDLLELSVSPTDPEPGENVTAFALAQNNGSVATSATNVSFHLDGDRIGTIPLDGLGPNEQGSAEITFTAARSGALEARLDTDDTVDEYDEDNNQGQRAIELASEAQPPDLTVRSVASEGDIGQDDEVRFVAAIANEGAGPSPEALVEFRADGEPIGAPVSVDGLPAGSATNVTSPAFEHDGETELEVVVDPNDGVGEADETNNVVTESIDASAAVGVPVVPIAAVIGLSTAALAARRLGGTKRKPP